MTPEEAVRLLERELELGGFDRSELDDALRVLLAERKRSKQALFFVEELNRLDGDEADGVAEILANATFWATDYAHAMGKLADVMHVDEQRLAAEARVKELEAERDRLKAKAIRVADALNPDWIGQREAKDEIARLRGEISVMHPPDCEAVAWQSEAVAWQQVDRLRAALKQARDHLYVLDLRGGSNIAGLALDQINAALAQPEAAPKEEEHVHDWVGPAGSDAAWCIKCGVGRGVAR